MVLALYKMDGSPPVRAVLMTIQALNLDVEYIEVDLINGGQLKEEFTRINSQHTLPMLRDDDFYVWDSHAIAIYLITKYGKDDSLYPEDHRKRALINQRLHFDSGILFPAYKGAVTEDLSVTFVDQLSDKHRRVVPLEEVINIYKHENESDITYCSSTPKETTPRSSPAPGCSDTQTTVTPSLGPLFFGIDNVFDKELKPENLNRIRRAYDFTEKYLNSEWIAGDNVTLADICCVATLSSMDAIKPIDKSKYPNIIAWWERCSKQEFYKKGNASGLEVFRKNLKIKLTQK